MNYITSHLVTRMDYMKFVYAQIKVWGWTNSFQADVYVDRFKLCSVPNSKSVIVF